MIADLSSNPFRNRNVVDSAKFFPRFCKVLCQHGFSSVFVHDLNSIEKGLEDNRPKNILIFVAPGFQGDAAFCAQKELRDRFLLIFNPPYLQQLVSDRQATNRFLLAHGVPVPRSNVSGKKVFSIGKSGYPNSATIVDTFESAPSGCHNTEFIDTRIEVDGKQYYTSLRLMCIGPSIMKCVIRARDCSENRPEARDRNTPVEPDLIRNIYKLLVVPNYHKLVSLAALVEVAYGPGIYAHDVVLDRVSGDPFICESEFKFYPGTYMRRFRGLLDSDNRLISTSTWDEYAKCSALEFIRYCCGSLALNM